MSLTNFAKNEALDAIAAVAGFASLHNGDPGTTGANEISGGAYARQAVLWDPASGGIVNYDNGTPVIFDVEGGDSVSFGGLWTAASGGSFVGGDSLSNPFTFTIDGTYELTVIRITA